MFERAVAVLVLVTAGVVAAAWGAPDDGPPALGPALHTVEEAPAEVSAEGEEAEEDDEDEAEDDPRPPARKRSKGGHSRGRH